MISTRFSYTELDNQSGQATRGKVILLSKVYCLRLQGYAAIVRVAQTLYKEAIRAENIFDIRRYRDCLPTEKRHLP
jgi:hypothetical protein